MTDRTKTSMRPSLERQRLYEELNRAVDQAPNTIIDAAVHIVKIAEIDQLRGALAARLVRAIVHVSELTNEQTLAKAVSLSSDYAVLLEVIAQPEAIRDFQEDGAVFRDPLRSARLAGLMARQQLLELGGAAYSATQVAEVLGISRQAVDNRRKRGKLLAVTLGRRGNYYPSWQIQDGQVLNGLGIVLAELREHDPWTQLAFMLNPNTWLDDETPVDALHAGLVEQVRDAANVYGEQIAA